jgi:hypothetical protein
VKYWTDIVAQEMVLLGSGVSGEGGSGGRSGWTGPSRPTGGPSDTDLSQPDDDLPF